MTTKRISQDTLTSGEYSPKHWMELRREIMDNFSNTEKWREAYDKFFLLRIETRFIKPVKLIINSISPDESKSGEGFTITAILCILIEYLQAYYEGCNYTTGEPKLYEYKSSKAMFKNFFTMHEPFKTYFSPSDAEQFYDEVRCGLLHEAATKGNSKIHANKAGLLLEKSDEGFILDRDALLAALEDYLDHYRKVLLFDDNLKKNFFRKIDALNGIEREFYFAYGSNLLKDRFEIERQIFVHTCHKAMLIGYKLVFNKKSKDTPNISYANLEDQPDEITWGVLYEIDKEDLVRLKRDYEDGYDRRPVKVNVGGRSVPAVTFMSNSICDELPRRSYVQKILTGAEEKGLPADYIEKIRQCSNL